MKRMRFFAVIFTILISIVGSNFVAQRKVSAQATPTYTLPSPESYGKYLDASKNLVSYFDPQAVNFYSSYTSVQKSAYQQYFQSLKGIATQRSQELANNDYNDGAFQVNVLNDFIRYLTGLRDSITDPLLLKTNDDSIALANAMHTKATNDQLTDAALIAAGGGAGASASELQSASNANVAKTQKEGAPKPGKCTLFSGFDLGACVDAFFAWIITHTLLSIAGWLLWVTATVMNYAINIGILQFASWAPDTLYPIWLVVRQITSLFVVFAGLWLGFMYIIDKGDQFKKYIPTVVIFALFVNFSYPLTRTIIDVSNIISLNVYASTVGASTLEASTITVGADKTAGSLIMNKLGLIGIVDYATGDTTEGEGSLNSINSIGPALLAVVFILYAAWIFFIISALLVTRTAVLVFLIIASPLLFVDKIIPKLGEHATKLRGIFIEMLFVGPVFTIMLALTLKFLEVFQSGPLSSAGAIGSASGDSAITMFFNMLMMLIMLHIMFKVTKATSGKIGETVAGVAGMAGGVAFGGVARAGFAGLGAASRATLGRGAASIRDGAWVQRNQSNMFGRAAHGITNSIATSSFDGRQLGFVQKNANKLNLSRGMGTGSKLGYEARAEERDKDRVERLRGIGVHKKNTYARNEETGELELKNKKGSVVETEEAKKLRSDYITKSAGISGGALFNATPQEKSDLEFRLQESAKKKTYTEEEKAERQLKALEAIAAKGATPNISTSSGTTATSVATPQAVNVAINNNVALPGKVQTPAPTAGAVGYPTNPKSALTIETPAEATARVASSQEAHVLDAVPF